MKQKKQNRDIISEEEFTAKVVTNWTDPQADSPAGADVTEDTEIHMGVDFGRDAEDEEINAFDGAKIPITPKKEVTRVSVSEAELL